MGCSVAIFVDDLLNGNVTSNGSKFFTGLNTLYAEIDNLDAKLVDINGNFSDLQSTAGTSHSQQALDSVTTAQTRVK